MLVYTEIFSFNTFWWNLPLEAFTRFFETWIIYNRSILLRFDIFEVQLY